MCKFVRRSLIVVLLFAAALVLPLLTAQAPQGKKYAVLVGVKDYDHSKLHSLPYAVDDVSALADLLGKHGYQVTLLRSGSADAALVPTLANIQARLGEVLGRCKRHDTVLVALAGHGLQFEKQQATDPDDAYFCPQDARPLPERRETLLSLRKVYRQLDDSGAGVKLLLVDACRDDPTIPRGAARGQRQFVAAAAARGGSVVQLLGGESAWESPRLKHGVFFYFVLEGLRGKAAADGEVTWDGLQQYVRRRVSREVAGLVGGGVRQTPALTAGELAGEPPVLLTVAGPGPDVQATAGAKLPPARAPFDGAKAKALQQAWARHLGRKAEEALDLGGVTMRLVLIPPGTFTMGSPASENGHYPFERQHEVTLTRPFAMAIHEVTVGQFRAFVEAASYRTQAETDGRGGWGLHPGASEFKGPDPKFTWRNVGFRQGEDEPVVNVSWQDALKFCEWLSRTTKRRCRLPTEAEWEYACRAGTTTRFSCGDSDEDLKRVANLADASFKRRLGYGDEDNWIVGWDDGHAFTAPVGSFQANAWGLFDMHGNVWEWMADWYGDYPNGPVTDPTGPATGTNKVIRGGSYHNGTRYSRFSYRHGYYPEVPSYNDGFRVVADVP